jgi:eukaryotic translation initiation factor 2C
MAGPTKKRAQREKQPQGSSNSSSSESRDAIRGYDGNRDPNIEKGKAPIDYSKENDLKNISEFLGFNGWYTARGVSTNALLS